MKYFCILLFLIITQPCAVTAQVTLSSLNSKLIVAKTDSARAKAYFDLAQYYLNKNVDSCVLASRQSINAARKADDKKGIAKALILQGKALTKGGNNNEGIQCYFTALRICEKENLAALTAKIYNNLGIIYTDRDEDTTAITYYTKALAIRQDSSDADITPAFQLMTNIAQTYMQMGLPDSADVYNKNALLLAKMAKDTQAIAILLYNIGDNYTTEKKYAMALPYIDSAMRASEKINDYEGIAYCNNNLGVVYEGLGQYKKSIAYSLKALAQSNYIGMRPQMLAYRTLYLDYFALKMYIEALTYRNLEKALNDTLNSVEKNKQLKQIQQNYAVEKKQQQIDMLVTEKENSNLKQNIAFFASLVTSVLLFAGLFLYLRISRLKNILQNQNEEMHVKNNMLEELNETKNKLFSIVGHDLKGPFNSFKGLLELIKSDQLTQEESKLFLNKLYDSFTETLQLLNNLLIWANTQVKGINVSPSVFNVWQMVNQNIKLSEVRANQKNILIETNETLKPLYVHSDMYMTDIIIRNLLENAIKFSNPGGTVKIFAEEENGFIKVSIVDNGKGISIPSQATLFNKMSFNTTRGTAGEKGSGLGLHITKEMVEKNGGKIWFESMPNQGSTFYFTIPASQPS